ncbi:efflux RND transporter periplasmic adaptor subunit [soil metagenome]
MNIKDSNMQKIVNTVLFGAALFLASCGSKTDTGKGNDLAAKKAKLAELKTQQQKVNDDITALEAEITKLDPSSKPAEKTKLVSLTPITPGNFTHYVDLQGSISADQIAYVAPRNGGGIVRALYVKKGDNVKKGQLLAKLDDAVYLKNVKQLESQLDYAKNIYQRQKNLWDQQIGTEVQLISAQNNVTNFEDQIATLKEQQDMTNIRADVSGTADIINVRVGEMFTGYVGNQPQIGIVNNSALKVQVQVPERYIDKVNDGSNMIVTFPDLNKTFNTKIAISGNYIDPNNRSFFVEGKLPADKDLRPNLVAQVRIQDYAAANAITVPLNTLQTDEKGKYVMVAMNESGRLTARKKAVTIGELYEDKIEIKSGLQAGDQVITEGFQELYDGQLITTSLK